MTDMMVLYGAKGSGAAAVEAALRMTGAPYRVVDAASWQPGPGLDELRTVNPLAQVPTLVLPEGTVMSESAAILAVLGLRYPDSGLLPADPAARAQLAARTRLHRSQLLRVHRRDRLPRAGRARRR